MNVRVLDQEGLNEFLDGYEESPSFWFLSSVSMPEFLSRWNSHLARETQKSDLDSGTTSSLKTTTVGGGSCRGASAAFAGSALLAQLFRASLLSVGVPDLWQQATTASADHLAAMRAQMGSTPIQSQPLAENLTLLSGRGGNVLVLNSRIQRPHPRRG